MEKIFKILSMKFLHKISKQRLVLTKILML